MYFIIVVSFIITRNNHKCNIYNFCRTKMKRIQFFSRIQKVAKILIFLIKIIYNIFCIIKKYINFEYIYFFFSFKKTFSNPIVSSVQSKTPKNFLKKINKNFNSKKEREK